jgi:hypothetical protein
MKNGQKITWRKEKIYSIFGYETDSVGLDQTVGIAISSVTV